MGPTVEDAINEALQTGADRIVFVPFGFVSNHVEVLYDNDVECKELVEAKGATYMVHPCQIVMKHFYKQWRVQ
ncbi:MAG: ferrochelatase [Veillonella parvula]